MLRLGQTVSLGSMDRPWLIVREAGNYILPAHPGLIVKESYWRWPERNLAGNAIDFFMRVLGLSFHDAMRQITGT